MKSAASAADFVGNIFRQSSIMMDTQPASIRNRPACSRKTIFYRGGRRMPRRTAPQGHLPLTDILPGQLVLMLMLMLVLVLTLVLMLMLVLHRVLMLMLMLMMPRVLMLMLMLMLHRFRHGKNLINLGSRQKPEYQALSAPAPAPFSLQPAPSASSCILPSAARFLQPAPAPAPAACCLRFRRPRRLETVPGEQPRMRPLSRRPADPLLSFSSFL